MNFFFLRIILIQTLSGPCVTAKNAPPLDCKSLPKQVEHSDQKQSTLASRLKSVTECDKAKICNPIWNVAFTCLGCLVFSVLSSTVFTPSVLLSHMQLQDKLHGCNMPSLLICRPQIQYIMLTVRQPILLWWLYGQSDNHWLLHVKVNITCVKLKIAPLIW